MSDRASRLPKEAMLAHIADVRAARNEDTRMCVCGDAASRHLIRFSDGEVFHCCEEGCDCKKYEEATQCPA